MKKIYLSIFFCSLWLALVIVKEQKISEEKVRKTFNDFFYALDNDYTKIKDFVTDDFVIYEVGRKWTTDEFLEFVKSFGSFEAERKFSNMIIDTDINSAHIRLEHTGNFVLENPTEGEKELYYEWLESAYLVKQGNDLKFKFYFSEQVNE